MGVIGFAGAFAFGHWGLARSTATNAALLIIVEPVSIMALSPLVLGERMSRREAAGAALAVLGAVVVILNGVPGVTRGLAPHWRGDLLLVLSGLAFGAYTLLGRGVLSRHSPLRVTARSIVWGAVVMVPFVVAEWLGGARPVLTAGLGGRRPLPGGGDHGVRLPAVELGAGAGRRSPGGGLRHRAADRRRHPGDRAPARAADGVHGGRRRADRGGAFVDGHRAAVTVY